jgi:hypothetical protein
MGLARKHVIRTSIAAATLAALVTPALSAGAAWSGPSVKVTSPTMGASVAGVVTLVSDGGEGTYAGWNPVNVTFQVDGVNLGSATAHTTAGWSIAWDSTKVADGFHQIAATAYGAKGRSYRSPAINVTVANASAGATPVTTTTTTVPATTTTTVAPTTTTTTPPATTGTWGEHMGVSMMVLTPEYIDRTAALGVKWIRMSVESGWGFDQNLITYAHSKGLKVLQACQKGGHTYSGTATDVDSFATYCASWVDKGVDAIEVGNEWNHMPFYNYNGTGAPDTTGVSQARYFDATVAAIRVKSTSIPVMNSGWSPESSPRLPQEMMDKTLASSDGRMKQGSTIAHHGYAYNCDSPLRCAYPNRRDWNTFLATQDVYAAAKARGYDRGVWLTELGAPSGNGTNLYTGTAFTLASQEQMYKDYLAGVTQMRNAGTPIQVMFFHTIKDGQSATNAAEQTFGLYDVNGVLKPAGAVVKNQAALAW